MLFLQAASLEGQSRTQLIEGVPDPRGEAELTICSQNLKNYGLLSEVKKREDGVTEGSLRERESELAERFAKGGCDVIAVQELLGKSPDTAMKGLASLAAAVRKHTNRFFDIKVGDTNDNISRVGFLVAKDRAEIANTVTYKQVILPTLTDNEKPRLFSRSPLEIQLNVKPKGEGASRNVSIITFHFKSKSGGQNDPALLEWETYRMEMAEGLRRIIESRYGKSFTTADTPLVVLGDRNANFDVATAKILEGELILKSFQAPAICRLSKRGVPLCQAGAVMPQKLFSVLTTDPQSKGVPGTFVYKGTFSWIDDIIMPQGSLPLAWASFDSAGDYDSGVISTPKDASDHSMVYVRLNW